MQAAVNNEYNFLLLRKINWKQKKRFLSTYVLDTGLYGSKDLTKELLEKKGEYSFEMQCNRILLTKLD